MSRIKSLKLISSEEIIGKVVSESDVDILLDDVLALMAQQTPQGMQIGLVPFMLSNPEGQLLIQKTAVVASTTPSNDLEKGYIQRTSGIAIATKI